MATRKDESRLALTLTTSPLGVEHERGTRSYLLCFEDDVATTFDLPAAGEIVIGRAPDADLQVRDAMASRHHARILIAGSNVLVSDLDSRHGTRINGEPLRGAHALISGDALSLGTATLVFHRTALPSRTRTLLEPAAWRQRLEEEIERALHYDREVSLVIVAVASGVRRDDDQALDRSALSAALADQIRTIDAAGFITREKLAVIMPELGAEQAGAVALRLLAALSSSSETSSATPATPGARSRRGDYKIGVASCPHDGADGDTLLSSALAACDRARSGAWSSPEEGATVLSLGQTRVLVADPAMQRVYKLLEKLARSDLPILIHGETGTGKELAAAAIHHHSPRQSGPFVALNCAALSESLVESELFGHEKGAFTDAKQAKPGVFERAHGGTLFLDEVGELALGVQAKLLRVLETGRVMRLGATDETDVDVRIVAATNRDLHDEIDRKSFRSDLFFRLGAGRVVLPPLRDRSREIPLLARMLLDRACTRLGRDPLELGTGALRRLLQYAWPGNIRELKNAMDFAAATAETTETTIDTWHLPDPISTRPGASSHPPTGSAPPGTASVESSSRSRSGDAESDPVGAAARGRGSPPPGDTPPVFRPIGDEVRELERKRMIQALEATGWVQNQAARLISMPLRTFVTKLKRYQIRETRAGE